MKITVVPAEVTSVEDRIMGNLSFMQLVLVMIPLFVSAGIYAAMPPFMTFSKLKLVFIVSIACICGFSALRIHGRVVLLWFVTCLRFQLRPRLYLFDKNTLALRKNYVIGKTIDITEAVPVQASTSVPLSLVPSQNLRALEAIENPAAHVRFKTTKKGGLYVHLSEAKD